MPILQNGVGNADVHNSSTQKLSKIETLRLARNYIVAMSQTLQEGKPMDLVRFIKILSRELSQTTANLLNGSLVGPATVNNNNSNSFLAYRRFFTDNDYAMNGGSFQEISNSVPYRLEWQDFNGDCNSNSSNYNNWYANYKFHGGTARYENGFRYADSTVASENCFYDGCSKQLFYSEW